MADYNIDSLLHTIFDTSECNTWQPLDKIQLVNKELEKLKAETRDFLSNADYDIVAILNESNELCAESGALVQEMEACKEEIEEETMADILEAIDKQNQLTKELQTVNFAVNLIFDVVTCGNYVKEFESGRIDKSFNRACESVYDLLQFLENPAEGFTSLDIYNTTKQNAQLILESLLRDLYIVWDRMIAYNIKSGAKKTEVTMTFNMEERLVVVDALNALCKCKRLMDKVKKVSQFLLKDVLEPIIHFDCTVYAETDDQVTIIINHKQKNPPYDNVIANLRILFHFLSNKLNVDFDYHMTLMTLIGETIAVEFIDILVKDCLLNTIPNNLNDLQTYGKITAEIEDFQQFLLLVKFFYKDKYSLLAYMKDVDILFANKSSQYFLETARTIMLKDLSVTMSIGVESIPENSETPSSSKLDKSTEEALKVLDETLPKSLFYFPRCMISKTAQELLDLVYVMMEQAVQCSDVVSKKLYNTTRLVFELYDAVVPYHHENYLQTIPQYVALFHNNCMFLAHHLQTFGDKWLSLMEGRRVQYPVSFVDHVQQLRALAHRHLAAHARQQRAQILDNIRSSGTVHKWLSLMEGRRVQYPVSFVDHVQQLRALAHRHLAAHARQQRAQILDNIRSSGTVHKWLSLMEGRRVQYPVSFVDHVQQLRALAHRHLAAHARQQRAQILDNIRSSGTVHKWLSLMEGRRVQYPVSFVDHVQQLRALAHRHLAAHARQQRAQILDNIRSSGTVHKWLSLMEGRRVQYPVSFVDHVQQLRALAHRHLAAHARQQRAQILDNIRSSGTVHKWLSLMEGRRVQYPVSFVDHVQQLRALAHRHLAAHARQQRTQILDNIRSSDLNNMAMKDVLGDDAEAAIRQSLRQLQLLKNVWIGVLPHNVFTRLMATLVNMFVEELIHRVCTVEDISMEMATQLTDMYALVVQKAPQLFQKPTDVEEHVKSWVKLQELIFVLGGSLKDIDNHWNDGKGPLAVHFKTDELRCLIKALFQNTQFRANLLSKIK